MSIDHRQARAHDPRQGRTATGRVRGLSPSAEPMRSCDEVGLVEHAVRLIWRYRDSQPTGEQNVELSLAAGAAQADGRCTVVDSQPSPQADEMPLARQLRCRLGLLAVSDFGLRAFLLELGLWTRRGTAWRDVGYVGRSVPACSATM